MSYEELEDAAIQSFRDGLRRAGGTFTLNAEGHIVIPPRVAQIRDTTRSLDSFPAGELPSLVPNQGGCNGGV